MSKSNPVPQDNRHGEGANNRTAPHSPDAGDKSQTQGPPQAHEYALGQRYQAVERGDRGNGCGSSTHEDHLADGCVVN